MLNKPIMMSSAPALSLEPSQVEPFFAQNASCSLKLNVMLAYISNGWQIDIEDNRDDDAIKKGIAVASCGISDPEILSDLSSKAAAAGWRCGVQNKTSGISGCSKSSTRWQKRVRHFSLESKFYPVPKQ